MAVKITPADLKAVAREWNVNPAALKAVMDVESAGSGFLPDGKSVKILFERHVMWDRLRERGIDPSRLAHWHPGLCGEKWDPKRYPYGSQNGQYLRVAAVIAWGQKHEPSRWESYKKAAYEACSWGLFQLMGYHYAAAGYPNVYAMKHAFEESELEQLRAILRWMHGNGLIELMRSRNWTSFVRRYNGSGQVPYYRARLVLAYAKAKAQGY